MRQELEGIAAALRSASTLIEGKFLEVGNRLESAIAVLDRLTARFAQLSSELEGEELQATTGSLSAVAARVAEFAGAHRGERETLARTIELTGGIDRHLATIRQAVKTIAMLATNAKIAAAGIGGGADFINFSAEIGHSLGLAQVNLNAFGKELADLGQHLRASSAAEAEFGQRHAEVLQAIPERLATGVNAIAIRRTKAAAAAAAVGARSQRVQQRVSDAVMALQIGDITRQRIEHVDEAVTLLGAVERGDGEWQGMTENQRRQLIAECCALQAAQLSDGARQFEREIRQIFAALGDLASDARAILDLGTEAYGASDSHRGIFLSEIEADVSGAHALLDGFRTARSSADHVAARVADAAGKLVNHISMVGSLEADIRIMGLNTGLKCARMGSQGRPLSVIAQELRACANQTAAEATAIMTGIEEVAAGARTLGGGGQGERAGDIAAVAEMLTGSVGRLAAAGQSLAAALAMLERDSDMVAELLDGTAGGITLHEEIGTVLSETAERLHAIAAQRGDQTDDVGEAAARLMAAIARRYTMAREREIHERAGHGAVDAPPPSDTAAATVEDVLF